MPKPRLFLRRFEEFEAKPITGTEGGISPVLSPDDKWICFYADKKIKKVRIEGGVAQDILEVSEAPFGMNWGQDGSLIFGQIGGNGLLRIPPEGGKAVPLTKPDPKRKEYNHRLPCPLPGNKGLLFTVMADSSDIRPSVAVLNFTSLTWEVLFEDGSDARYIPTGHLVFLRQGKLMATPFDLKKLETKGEPVPVIECIMHALNAGNTSYNSGAGQFCISTSGSLIYVSGGAIGGTFPDLKNPMFWVDQKGNAERVGSYTQSESCARISPDGKKIAYSSQGYLWIFKLERGVHERLTSAGVAAFPIWSPDGTRLFFSFREFGPMNLFWMPIDGSTGMERLRTSEFRDWASSWSPDGEILAFVQAGVGNDVLLLNLKAKTAVPFAATNANERFAEFSPDGKWLAYTSDELGTEEIFVRALSGGRAYRITSENGRDPLWAKSGKRIYFRNSRLNRMCVVDILSTEPEFAVSKPRLLFDLSGYGSTVPTRSYDMTRDETRFLMAKWEERKPAPVTEMILVQNWFEELKRLVPAGK